MNHGHAYESHTCVSCLSHTPRRLQVFPRNPAGGFYQVYQPNKWRLKKEAAAAEKAAEKAEMAAAAAAAGTVQDSVVAS